MKRIIRASAVACVLLAFALCAYGQEYPTVNVPPALRQRNYSGGSCVHATLISLLRWQGQLGVAKDWRRKYSGGEYPYTFAGKLARENIRYAYTTDGDVKFLEWAIATRRGCGIDIYDGRHMVALVYLDAEWAAILDNNDISEFIWIPRETLITAWQAGKGWAVAPIYSPAAPLPQ